MSRDSAVNVFSSLVLERSNLGFRETTTTPMPTFGPKWEVTVNVRIGEG